MAVWILAWEEILSRIEQGCKSLEEETTIGRGLREDDEGKSWMSTEEGLGGGRRVFEGADEDGIELVNLGEGAGDGGEEQGVVDLLRWGYGGDGGGDKGKIEADMVGGGEQRWRTEDVTAVAIAMGWHRIDESRVAWPMAGRGARWNFLVNQRSWLMAWRKGDGARQGAGRPPRGKLHGQERERGWVFGEERVVVFGALLAAEVVGGGRRRR